MEHEIAYASYDALRNLFNADGDISEEGLRLVIEQARRNAKVAPPNRSPIRALILE